MDETPNATLQQKQLFLPFLTQSNSSQENRITKQKTLEFEYTRLSFIHQEQCLYYTIVVKKTHKSQENSDFAQPTWE